MQHTTYMTVRSGPDNLQVEPWEYGYNYLHGNRAKLGIHQFDQDDGCGDLTGILRIHNNVIVDQAGAGISVASQCGWSMDAEIENNVLINVGLPAAWDNIDPETTNGAQNDGILIGDSAMTGTMHIHHNIIYNWNSAEIEKGASGCIGLYGRNGDDVTILWNNNICYTEHDQPFMDAGFQADQKYDNVFGRNNIWFDSAGTTANDEIPAETTDGKMVDPKLIINGAQISLAPDSSALNTTGDVFVSRDIYGVARGSTLVIGAVVDPDLVVPVSPPSAPTLTIELAQ